MVMDHKSPEYAEILRKRDESIIKNYGSLENYKLAAKEWGRKGGKKGGNGLQMLTPEQRREAGKLGYLARIEKLKKELGDELNPS